MRRLLLHEAISEWYLFGSIRVAADENREPLAVDAAGGFRVLVAMVS
jgi:hypothetical protein